MEYAKQSTPLPVLNPYFELHLLLLRQNIPANDLTQIRRKLVASYAWAVPSPDAIQLISEHGPIIELGAGTGYWQFCLRQMGVDILSYDRNPSAPPHWSPVQAGDETVLNDPRSPLHQRSLFLCWPPLDEPLAFRALELYRGETVVEIGEPGGGRTGTLDFSQALEARWTPVAKLALPQWPGFRDELRIWTRSPRP